MKKIAFLGEPWTGAIVRATAFIKTNPDYEYTFVLASFESTEVEWQDTLPSFVKIISKNNFEYDNYDLVLPLNDRHFQSILDNHSSVKMPNMVDKTQLNDAIYKFGQLTSFKSSNFSDNDIVFIKPRIGAGQYTTDSISYRIHRYGDIKLHPQLTSLHTIQNFVDCPIVVSVTVGSNGLGDLGLIDVTEAHHGIDRLGKNINMHLVSMYGMHEKYQDFVDISEKFLKFINYDSIPGIFMLQFMTDVDGQRYLNDFNVRTGPAQDVMTKLGFLVCRTHRVLPFIAKDSDYKSLDLEHPRWRCYLENNRVPLSNRVKNIDYTNRKLVSENKTSGLIRSDYQSYIELIN